MTSEQKTIACTLTSAQLQNRLTSIGELARDALRHHERHDLVLKLHYALDAAERVGEMVGNEKECCSFLTFDLRVADEVKLTITAPEEGREAAESLFEQFIAPPLSSPAPGCCGQGKTCSA